MLPPRAPSAWSPALLLVPCLALGLACSCTRKDAEASAPGGRATPAGSGAGAAGSAGGPPVAAAGGAAAALDETAPPGIDISKLDEFERKVFFRIINKEPSACGAAHSLIHSAKNDKACRKSFYAIKYVARLVDAAYTDSEIGEALEKRYRGGPPKTIDVSEAPMKGPAGARITLVEFADYECPHCKRLQPVIRQILDEYRGDVRLYFKHYPLPQHEHARLAAEAAVAATRQGKFWQFEEKVWANQDSLQAADLEKYAREAGLDLGKWRTDKDSVEAKNRVQKDKAEGGVLGLSSTPTVFLNGREYTDAKDADSFKDWIDEELGR